jgi:rhomboid family GlyGly-CTERM serine protease
MIRDATQNLLRAARRLPGVSLLLSAAAVAAYAPTGVSEALQFDRALIAAGELWRVVTGHWTHWSADVFAWDLAVFAIVGAMCERMDRRRHLACVGASALAISLSVWLWLPELRFYRGLSGIDAALVAMLAARIGREKIAAHEWGWALAVVAAFAGFAAKVAFEMATGATVFAENAPGVAPVPLAHAVGGGVGLLLGVGAGPVARASSPASWRPAAIERVS